MGRRILAVVVALIVAMGIIAIGQMGMAAMWAAPSPTVRQDPDAMRAYLEGLPTSAFVTLAVIYAVASFAGGFIATKMARRFGSSVAYSLIVGVLLFLAGAYNFLVALPYHPSWATALCLILFIPMALLGYRLAR
jgi:hypothetical protein